VVAAHRLPPSKPLPPLLLLLLLLLGPSVPGAGS
jgi:hypothetical protein